MNTFPMNNDEYSVEEISYDDMMSILISKRAGNTDSHIEVEIVESSTKPISRADDQARFIERPISRQDDLARRISENANQQLPDWLLNN